ncbi:MAG: thiamine phosphate synthase [Phycisphaerae bacterium]
MEKTIYRILDANLNRGREGLRVVEEYLRFVREDRRGSWFVKRWRHQFREMTQQLGQEKLLSARAAISDVGKDLASPSQPGKQNPQAITSAGLKRIQEALRVIEEYSSPIAPTVSDLASRMRFEIYQFEKELFLSSPRTRFAQIKLYLLIGSDFCPMEKIVELAGPLLDAGVDCLQLREKKLPDKEIFRLSEKLAKLCRDKEKLFIVNDRPDIALAVAADGVHIGQEDLPIDAVRQILGPDRIIGISTHTIPQLREAIEKNPSYIAIGPAFDTTTKPHEPTAGLEYITAVISELCDAGLPEVAIGGITIDNLPKLMSTGVRRVAVCSAILSAKNPLQETERFASLLSCANPPD